VAISGESEKINTKRAKVGLTVATRAVPVSGNGLGLKRNGDAKVLRHTIHKIAGKPQMVTSLNALSGSNLELPLAGQDLSVDTRDLETSVQASAVVGLNDGITCLFGVEGAGPASLCTLVDSTPVHSPLLRAARPRSEVESAFVSSKGTLAEMEG
jgi:hypothetical protein